MTLLKRIFLLIAFLWLIGFCAYIIRIQHNFQLTSSKPNAVVVLTGGSNRIEEALDLLSKFDCKNLFISGVNRNVTRYDILNRIQKNRDLEDVQIDLGYKARNTHENAQEVVAWLKKENYKKIVLVTAYYHLPRSILELQAIAPQIQVAPYAVFPDYRYNTIYNIPTRAWLLFKEYHKYLFALIRVNIM